MGRNTLLLPLKLRQPLSENKRNDIIETILKNKFGIHCENKVQEQNISDCTQELTILDQESADVEMVINEESVEAISEMMKEVLKLIALSNAIKNMRKSQEYLKNKIEN